MGIKVEDVVAKYVELRNELDVKRRQFKEEEAIAKKNLERLETWLLDKARDVGTDSFKTKHGTAFKTTKDYARVAGPDGWDLMTAYAMRTGDFLIFEKRVAKLHFKELLANNKVTPEDIGVEYVVEQVIQVRKS